MSHHKHGFIVYPLNEARLDNARWRRADAFINGFEYFNEKGEAVAHAKIASLSTQFPMVVEERPRGGVRPALVEFFIIGKWRGRK